MNGIRAMTTSIPTPNPLVAPPAIRARVSSAALRGASSRSAMFPCILLARIDDEVLAKAFCMTLIITSPGIMKVAKGRFAIFSSARPKARENMARSIRAVMAGVATVCTQTMRNLRTSRWYSAHIPRQFTRLYSSNLGLRSNSSFVFSSGFDFASIFYLVVNFCVFFIASLFIEQLAY